MCENIYDRRYVKTSVSSSSFLEEEESPLTLCCCVSGPSGDPIFEISHNVTAVLGEDVDLICEYRGESKIVGGDWTRRINSKRKSKGLAGFQNGIPYGRNGFSEPGSMTNLTVRMEVLSVDAEGEYICEFESEEEYYSNSVFLSIVGKSTSCCMLMAPECAWIFIFETLLTSGVIRLSATNDITIGHRGALEGSMLATISLKNANQQENQIFFLP